MTPTLVIAGPSAAGKTTVAELLIGGGDFELVRSLTTRERRGDGHDAEYIFVDVTEFDNIFQSGGVLESTEYAGNRYGTPKSEIERISSDGKTPILILDIEGVKSLAHRTDLSVCAVYIFDDLATLDRRLYDRYLKDSPTKDKLASYINRKEQNPKDFLEAVKYERLFYSFVRNDTPEKTAQSIKTCLADFAAGKSRDNGKISASLAVISGFVGETVK